jgi:branched-chain amino acid transport system ATP-binding protein
LLLEVKDLTVNYGLVQALNSISLNVNEGEIVAMIGPNGAGKSTALKAICGLLRATGGEITNGEIIFSGESIKNIPPHNLVRKGISLVPEGRRVFPTMTVLENSEMGSYIKKDKKAIGSSLDKIFNLFPVLNNRRKQKAGTLSSGEQQMLAIGRAFILQPKLLLLDEPSLWLSPNYVETVFEKLKEVNKDGTTLLLVEQNARMALEYADRAYVFKIGEIFFEGRGNELLKNDEVKKSFLGS